MLGPREILGLSSQLLPVMQWRTFYPRVRPLAAAGCGEPCLGKSCLLYAKQTATAGPRLVFVVLEFGQSKDFFSFLFPLSDLIYYLLHLCPFWYGEIFISAFL